MHKELVLSAFKKAKKEAKKATGVNMSITALAKKISDYMLEECRFQYHEKSLRNKYNLALKDGVLELKSTVANCLCCYLGYKSYEEFVINNGTKQETFSIAEHKLESPVKTTKKIKEEATSISEKLKIIIQSNKVTLIFCFLIFLLYFGLYMVNRHRIIIWDHGQYM